jgi:16S rRNA (cytosine967-C5)-methyltransferase
VSTTVELAKRGGLGRLAPVANGLLRAFLRCKDTGQPLTRLDGPGVDAAERLGLRHSLPDWLARDLLQWLPPQGADAFGVACNTPPAIDLRVNRLRTTPEALQQALMAAGVQAVPVAGVEMYHETTLASSSK